MRIVCLFMLMFYFSVGQTYAQETTKKEDKVETKKEDKAEKKKDDKPDRRKSQKAQSVGELAEQAGKRIWDNLKGFLNVVVDDVVEKKNKFSRKEQPKEKEKKKPVPKEKAATQEKPKKKSKN